ncbi:hypothetical protein J7M22_09240 [Candidatus Poribacteria bacterium]|nr:hypothetical protein [Candidatus Poribacteria bacterium]
MNLRSVLRSLLIASVILCLGSLTRTDGSFLDAPFHSEPLGLGGGGAMYRPVISPHNPNLMFVSCDMGGFYRSIDGGKTWTMIDGRQMSGSPDTPIAFHPTDPNTIYAYGFNALRISTDGGITWRPLIDNPPWQDNQVIAIGTDLEDPEFMLVGTEDSAYRSTDGGRTWRICEGVSGRVVGFYIDPTSPSGNRTCFVATDRGVYRSDDGGRSWVEKTEGLPWGEIRDFAAGADLKSGRVILYVTIPSRIVNGRFAGGVYRSFDKGESWQSAMGDGINTEIGLKDEYGQGEIAQYYFIACGEAKPETVYVTNTGTGYWPPYHFTVYRSDDAGDTWRYCFNGDPRFKEHNVENGWIVWDINWGWGGDALGFGICPTDPSVAAYTNSGEIYITHDGGETWQCGYSRRAPGQGVPSGNQRWSSVGLEVTTTWNYYIDPHRESIHYICYTDIGFARSEDGGETWQHSTDGSPWRNTFYELAFDPDVPGLIWAAVSDQHDIGHWSNIEGPLAGGGVVVSRDFGRTWRTSSSGLPDAPAVSIVIDPKSPPESRRLWVAVFGYGVYRSDDGGKSWTRKSNGLGNPGNMHVYSLRLHPDGTLFCLITGKRDGVDFPVPGGLWMSRDGGESWHPIADSLNLYWPMGFAVHPKDSRIIYLCASDAPRLGGGGLYKTTDGGKTWRKLDVYFPPEYLSYVHTFTPVIHPNDPNIVLLTTGTHGIFVSEDDGETWHEWKVIPFMNTHRITFDPSNSDVMYITTFGGGVWRVTMEGTSDTTPPDIGGLIPAPDSILTDPETTIQARITDNTDQLDTSSILLLLDGVKVSYLFKDGVLTYTPKSLSAGRHTVTVRASDIFGNTAEKTWSFTVKIEVEKPWDVNGDGVVNIFDIVIVGRNLGKSGEGLSSDVNGDGKVNIFDIVIVAVHINETADHAAPSSPLLPVGLRREELERWIVEAREADDGSELFKNGIEVLERLLETIPPERTSLLPCYPNPFNSETWIPYQLSRPSDVSIIIYDLLGRVIRRFNLGYHRTGVYRSRSRSVRWDGTNDVGEPIASGDYFVMLRTKDYRGICRVVLLK